jgi:hypothetical protein
VERREPTWLHEWPEAEREGWATKLKVIKAQFKVDRTGLSTKQLLRLKHARISKEQMRHFEDNAVSITEDQMDVKEDGKAGITYWAHGLKAICPGEIYDELVAILKGGTQKLPRKEDGHPEQMPGTISETIEGRHKFIAEIELFIELTPLKQMLGQLYQITNPQTFERATEIVNHLRERSGHGGLVFTLESSHINLF